MADGRWVMTSNELDDVVCGFDKKTIDSLPNYKKHIKVDNRNGDADLHCYFCQSRNLQSGFGGFGEGFGYLSYRCNECGGTTDFVYKDDVNKFFI